MTNRTFWYFPSPGLKKLVIVVVIIIIIINSKAVGLCLQYALCTVYLPLGTLPLWAIIETLIPVYFSLDVSHAAAFGIM